MKQNIGGQIYTLLGAQCGKLFKVGTAVGVYGGNISGIANLVPVSFDSSPAVYYFLISAGPLAVIPLNRFDTAHTVDIEAYLHIHLG